MRFGSPVFVFPAGLPFGEDRCAIAESATPR
jgi:hypothetical protein